MPYNDPGQSSEQLSLANFIAGIENGNMIAPVYDKAGSTGDDKFQAALYSVILDAAAQGMLKHGTSDPGSSQRNASRPTIYVNTSDDTIHFNNGTSTAWEVITVKDAAIVTAKLADNAVTNPKIADNAVDTAQLAPNSVENAQIAATAVDTGAIADDAVTRPKIADNAVGNDQVEGRSINSDKLIANSLLNNNYGPNSVDNAALGTNAVHQVNVNDGAIGKAELATASASAGSWGRMLVQHTTSSQNNLVWGYRIWYGTQTAYDAITTKDANTIYLVQT